MAKPARILWTDDEIDILRSHIIFLEERGYQVLTASNADDALEIVRTEPLDLIFLDEHMPGKSGLDILPVIKSTAPEIPVIMITKSEEENIMEQAIGSQIDDYLIKPVNPKQILLTIKKFLEQKKLVSEKTVSGYQSQFGALSSMINQAASIEDWMAIYKKLVFWELEIEKAEIEGLDEVLKMQKAEANHEFSRFIKRHYPGWIHGDGPVPVLSTDIIRESVMPLIDRGMNVFFLLIDNLRYDQWRMLYPLIQDIYRIEEERLYCSILPTATQYARNAIFSGLMPLEIHRRYPDWWIHDDEDETKNQFESELLEEQLKRYGKKIDFHYEKIHDPAGGQKYAGQLSNHLHHPLNVLVYNFVDMLSHARTESDMIRELAGDERAYRSITISWFRHSSLHDIIKELARRNIKLIITTDHGTTLVRNAIKVVGDRFTSTNIRYKTGRSLDYNPKDVFEVTHPEKLGLPRINVSSKYIFATSDDYMVYPKNFNHFVTYYNETFQHGGISLQEMLIPLVELTPKT
jgi:CheY-like chemotaxis protein